MIIYSLHLFLETLSHSPDANAGHLTTGAQRMCSTKAMGRSILGIATVEATWAKTFSCNLWSCHGGEISFLLVTVNVAYQRY